METTASLDDVYRVIHTDHHDPCSVLGMHSITVKGKPAVVVRAFLPDSQKVFVVPDEGVTGVAETELRRVHQDGFFESVVRGTTSVFPYRLRRITPGGAEEVFHDSYSFLPTVTDFDTYLFNAGEHHRAYEKLGAHLSVINGVGGIHFAVWAPGARSVSVIGDFNNWDRRSHAMRVLGSSGIWEIFIPGIPEGVLYKYQVKTQTGFIMDKTDPYAFEMEVRPRTAAKVNLLGGYTWNDASWLEQRSRGTAVHGPVAVYEVHPGSWQRGEGGRWQTYREMAEFLIPYVKSAGFTHIELMPVMEHPFDAS